MGKAKTGLRVVVFGGTGVAGSEAVRQSLADGRVAEVRAVVRRPTGRTSPRLTEIVHQDFGDLGAIAARLRDVDACFYCLGVSSSQVRDEAKYREITFDYALSAARTLLASSPAHVFHFVSGNSASTESRFMWARVKAETENALAALGLAGCVVYRPGYIHADETPPNAPFALRFTRALYPLWRLSRGLLVRAPHLAHAMLQAQVEGLTEGTLQNRAIRDLADRYAGN